MINFMLITNDPELAHHAESCGVNRIFVDLEQNGKKERQGHLDTLISQHCMSDVVKVKSMLSSSELLVRLNPMHEGTSREIDEAILGGADLLMLPMFRSADEVRDFSKLVGGRVGIIPLLETYDATQVIDDIVCIPGITEIYIGLNDLHMDMQLKFMFQPLANGLVDYLSDKIKAAGLPFGFGGIARVGEGVIPGEMVLSEHIRLGSTSVILSRTFHRKSDCVLEFKANLNLKNELDKLNETAKVLQLRSKDQVSFDRKQFQTAVNDFVLKKND